MKKLFPIFQNNPGLVYLDSAASTQKPRLVIEGVADFLAHDYANIHRGFYSLSERSENLYHQSKTLLADLINCEAKEIIYSYNASYCFNLLAQALINSKKIQKGDAILLGIREHHSDIVSRQMLAQNFGFEIRWIKLTETYDIDRDDFTTQYDEKVKLVAVSQISNVTGQITNITAIKKRLRDDTFFIVDGSQSVPHIPVDVKQIDCDALIMTAHKMFAETGLGMLYLKHQRIKQLNPLILGWWTIKDVSCETFSLQGNSDKREAGTPNIVGAVSLLKALEFIQSIGGMEAIKKHEESLVKLCNQEFIKRKEKVKIFWTLTDTQRVGVYSFEINGKSFNKVAENFAEENICVRGGGHCAYPLHKFLNANGSVRISLSVYNDETDIHKFFEVVDQLSQ